MASKTVTVCDVCGTQAKETEEDWIRVHLTAERPNGKLESILISRVHSSVVSLDSGREIEQIDVCGERCLHTLVASKASYLMSPK